MNQILLNNEQHWNLRFLQDFNKVDLQLLSESGLSTLIELDKTYPNHNFNSGCFVGNLVQGNLIFNDLCSSLLDQNKINNKCLRISALYEIQKYRGLSDLDILFIDQVDTVLMNQNQIGELIHFIDEMYFRCNLCLLNFPDHDSFTKAPTTLINILENSPFNLSIKRI